MVTFSGSPPKRWMFSLTHSRAATTSNIPTFAEYAYCSPKSDKSRYPSTFNRWLTDTNTISPFLARFFPCVMGSSLAPTLNPPPCNQNITGRRSEEHTSELQSRGHLVCRLLLEKKKH